MKISSFRKDNYSSGRRAVLYTVIAIVMASVFFIRLFQVQVIDGKMYYEKGRGSSVRTIDVSAPRGEILDRNGIPLVRNRMGCSIILDASYFPPSSRSEERNRIISMLLDILEDENENWSRHLPMEYVGGTLTFTDDSGDVSSLKEFLGLNSYATEQNCLDALKDKYKIEGYDDVKSLEIASVRYGMEIGDFSVSLPFTVAEDVSDETVLRVEENSSVLEGVDVEVKSYREYLDGNLAPHVLGISGAISADEYREKKDQGYLLNDSIGKSGIEKAMEEYLRGERGQRTVTTDYEGNVTTEYTKLPKQGDTVSLTIDSGLQRVAQNALANRINELYAENQKNSDRYGPADAGAVCVVDVETGAVLAMASYPTFNVELYSQDQTAYSGVSGSPLWNRVVNSAYAPGSTFKPCVALAGLSEGVITRNTVITCRREYRYFSDITYTCLGYHGNTDVIRALTVSCNIFFYETGRRLGISNIEDYATRLGLGQPTNIEIGEATGTLAGPETYNGTWTEGLTVQAAIGQANHAYTPLQLAVYAATIANGGTRYESYLVQNVADSDSGEKVFEKTPSVLMQNDFNSDYVDIVKEGMVSAAENGTTSSWFSSLDVPVAVKTGSPQTGVGNGCLITYAPADDPQIAIAVVIEEAGSGSATAPVAQQIYEYYFSGESPDLAQDYDTILP